MTVITCFNRSDNPSYGDAEYRTDLAKYGASWHELYLSGTGLTANGLAAGAAKNVIALELDRLDLGTRMPDLAKLFPKLKRLSIRRCGATDSDIACLAQLGSLEYLAADFSAFTIEGVRTLAGIASLKVISLCGVLLSQSSLPILLRAPRIERLDLRGTGVTDAGIDCGRVRFGCGSYVEPATYSRQIETADAH